MAQLNDNLTRAGVLTSNNLPELLRWVNHTSDNIDRIRQLIENRRPRMRLTKSTNQALTTAVEATVSWEAVGEQVGNANNFLWTVNDPTKLIVRTGGEYLVVFRCAFDANATGHRCLYLDKNGTRMAATEIASSGATFYTQTELTYVLNLADGDYLTCNALQNRGGALNIIAANTELAAQRLS